MPILESIAFPAGSYVFESFKEHTCIAAFSTNQLDLGFQNNPDIKDNRAIFLRKLGIDAKRLVCLQQVHGNNVFLATLKDKGRGAWDYTLALPGYDGIITSKNNLPLAVFSADCLSVFLLDVKKRIAALLHSGWRGTKDNIVGVAIGILKNKFQSQPEDILCALGPSIRSCCYEVGPEFKEYFPEGLLKRKDKIFLDIVHANLNQLLSLGVREKNIYDCGICTSCQNKDFFSYRKNGLSAGRMMSVIMMR